MNNPIVALHFIFYMLPTVFTIYKCKPLGHKKDMVQRLKRSDNFLAFLELEVHSDLQSFLELGGEQWEF